MRNAAARSNLLVPEVREVMDIRQAPTTSASRPTPSTSTPRRLCARLQVGQPVALQALPPRRVDGSPVRPACRGHHSRPRTEKACAASVLKSRARVGSSAICLARQSSIAETLHPRPFFPDLLSNPCYSHMVDHTRRIGQLRRRLTKTGSLGCSSPIARRPLSCWFYRLQRCAGGDATRCRLFTDGRYTVQAAEEVSDAKVQIVTSSPSVAAVEWLAAQPGIDAIGFDPFETTVADLSRWRAALPSKLRRSFLTALAAPLVEPLAGSKTMTNWC